MVWKLIRIDFEVTSEVFQKILMYDQIFEWMVLHEVPSNKKFGHTPQISENFRSGPYLSERTSKPLGGFCGVEPAGLHFHCIDCKMEYRATDGAKRNW